MDWYIIPQNGLTYFKNLAALLKGFQSKSDHFGTLYIKELNEKSSHHAK